MAANDPGPFHELTIDNLELPISNMHDMLFITHGKLIGTVSDRIDSAIVVVVGTGKGVPDGAFGYVKLALNLQRRQLGANGSTY